MTNDNLGRLFYEFLYFYGFGFDNSKYIVDLSEDDEENDPEKEEFILMQYVTNINILFL